MTTAGPEYAAPGQISRLRTRNLRRKLSLATREFALGVKALDGFVRGEPLYRIQECVFRVLAMESEPVIASATYRSRARSSARAERG